MKIILFFLVFIISLEAFAGSASRRRRRRERAAAQERLNQECKKVKAGIKNQSYECPELTSFLKENYLNYLSRGFNECVFSSTGSTEERALRDLKNKYCIKEAEKRYPEITKQLIEENEQQKKIIGIVAASAIVLFILGLFLI